MLATNASVEAVSLGYAWFADREPTSCALGSPTGTKAANGWYGASYGGQGDTYGGGSGVRGSGGVEPYGFANAPIHPGSHKYNEAQKNKDLEAGKARAKIVLADLESRKANFDKLIAAQAAKRPAIVEALEAISKTDAEAGAPRTDYLASYNRLRASKSHPKTVGCVANLEDMACGRCHMSVTAQLKNETRKGKMVFCPSCGAILYSEE
jgi:hypothetical protein